MRGLDSKQSKLGLVECLNHGLLHPFPVLHEKVRAQPAGLLVAAPLPNRGATARQPQPAHSKLLKETR